MCSLLIGRVRETRDKGPPVPRNTVANGAAEGALSCRASKVLISKNRSIAESYRIKKPMGEIVEILLQCSNTESRRSGLSFLHSCRERYAREEAGKMHSVRLL